MTVRGPRSTFDAAGKRPVAPPAGACARRRPNPTARMPQLDEALARLRAHDGVEHVVLLGRDGLVIRHQGARPGIEEAVAAMAPSLASGCDALGRASEAGPLATAVLEFERGVAVVLPLSAELLLAVLLRPQVAFAPLLRELRRERARIAAAV